MCQLGRIAPVMAAALMLSASVGCNSTEKKDAAPVDPPVMGRSEEQDALAKAQVPMGKQGEVDLVETAQEMREQYRQSLETLLAYYRRYGYFDKSNWAEKELRELANVTRYPYLGDRVASSPRHEAKEGVADADTLYAEARKVHQETTGLGGLLGDSKKKLKAALDMYRQIMDRHPTSDKIDDAAFFAGEIYASDAYKEYTLALSHYQRCLNWNPNTPHPVRLRMAYVYDYPLRDREKAVALYKEIIQTDSNRANVRFAQDRIRQLTDRASHEAPDAEPVPRR